MLPDHATPPPTPVDGFDLTPFRMRGVTDQSLAAKIAIAHNRDHLEELINEHPKVWACRNTVRRAPLRMEGWLRDNRPFMFVSGSGLTALVLGAPGDRNATTAPVVSDVIAVDLDGLTAPGTGAAWFGRLLSALDAQ